MKNKIFILGFLIGLFTIMANAQTIYYVNDSVASSGGGTTWASAFKTLPEAVTVATSGSQIWVAKGTYYPTTSTTNRNASFTLKDGVGIYGGFTGGETTISQRNWRTNLTILSGDIDKNNILDNGNVYSVIILKGMQLIFTATLDGFEISGGNASEQIISANSNGGGIYLVEDVNSRQMSPAIANCTFKNNRAYNNGGAIYIFAGPPLNIGTSPITAPTFINCQFINNTAFRGGAIYSQAVADQPVIGKTLPTFVNCVFLNNTAASGSGGAIFHSGSSANANLTLTNCSFLSNQAVNGGAIFADRPYDILTNEVNTTNCIFYDNGGSNTYYTPDGHIFQPQNCFFESTVTGIAGSHNIISDPSPFQSNTNLQLVPSSCAINTGSNTAISGFNNDLAGNNRIYNSGTVDMGAYEYQGSSQPTSYTPPTNTSNNALDFNGDLNTVSLTAVDLPNCIPNNLTLGNAITIEYWFKGSNLQSAVRFQSGSDYISAGWGAAPNFKHILSNSGGTAGIAVGTAATDGTWHHIAMTWQLGITNGFKSYLDGNLVEQKNASNTPLPSFSAGMFLGSNIGTGEPTVGTLDEVRVWNVARSQADLQANMRKNISTPQTGLLIYYKFNQGIANGNNAGIKELLNSADPGVFPGYLRNFILNGSSSNWVNHAPTIFYVKPSGNDANEGESWATAYQTLQKALTVAQPSDKIWVAAGTYYPTASTDCNISFSMKNNVEILGGFPATGTPALTDRNWATNATILSGNIGAANSTADNTNSVVYNNNNSLTASAILDGFTITAGFSNLYGGGMYNINASPTLKNIIFKDNAAGFSGGGGAGIFNDHSSPTLTNVIFTGNNGNYGGGMSNSNLSYPTLINTTFAGNTAIKGGGIYNNNAIPIIKNSIFWGNSSSIDETAPSYISTVSNSLIQGGYAGSNILNIDPFFVDAANGNFQLQATSCAFNVGDNVAINGTTTDIGANSRVYNNEIVDLGAYEYQGNKQSLLQPADPISTNNALNFDGINDFVKISTNDYVNCTNLTLPISDAITIEYWFKGTNIQSAVRFQSGSNYISAGWGIAPNLNIYCRMMAVLQALQLAPTQLTAIGIMWL